MQFQSPWVFIFLLLIPLLYWWKSKKNSSASLKYSDVELLKGDNFQWRPTARNCLNFIRLACILLLIIALARPRKGTVLSEIYTQGIAMEIVVDRSGSMEAQMNHKGQRINRLQAAKKVFEDFILGDRQDFEGRSGDLIGLVTFARYAETICPLIHPSDVLKEFFEKIQIVERRSEDGTSIGDAVALAAARLANAEKQIEKRNSKVADDKEPDFKIKSKVIILLTDGSQNAGQYKPMEAAKLAKKWGVKIYTIGLGSNSGNIFMSRNNLNEGLLNAMAEKTGGFYARADDLASLRKIIEKIDSLEKTKVKSFEYTRFSEKFHLFAFAAMGLLLLETVAGNTVLRKIP